jgi:hypothetical protein
MKETGPTWVFRPGEVLNLGDLRRKIVLGGDMQAPAFNHALLAAQGVVDVQLPFSRRVQVVEHGE